MSIQGGLWVQGATAQKPDSFIYNGGHLVVNGFTARDAGGGVVNYFVVNNNTNSGGNVSITGLTNDGGSAFTDVSPKDPSGFDPTADGSRFIESYIQTKDSYPYITKVTDANVLHFFTGNKDAMVIDASGNVGIGSSTPNAKHSVTGTAAGKMVQWITSAGTNMLDIVNDTATAVLKGIWDFSGATVKQHTYSSFSYATSTAWAGTTTIALGPAYTAESWGGVKCTTDVGTLYVAFDDGTNVTNYFQASTTVGTVTLSTNNTFTASEKRYVKIGNPASSPTNISCTVDKIVNN